MLLFVWTICFILFLQSNIRITICFLVDTIPVDAELSWKYKRINHFHFLLNLSTRILRGTITTVLPKIPPQLYHFSIIIITVPLKCSWIRNDPIIILFKIVKIMLKFFTYTIFFFSGHPGIILSWLANICHFIIRDNCITQQTNSPANANTINTI